MVIIKANYRHVLAEQSRLCVLKMFQLLRFFGTEWKVKNNLHALCNNHPPSQAGVPGSVTTQISSESARYLLHLPHNPLQTQRFL